MVKNCLSVYNNKRFAKKTFKSVFTLNSRKYVLLWNILLVEKCWEIESKWVPNREQMP